MHRLKGPAPVDPGRSGQTVTFHRVPPCTTPTVAPVLSLAVMPSGPRFLLDSYSWLGKPRQWLSVGSHPQRDLVLDECTVSATHCFLFRERTTGRLYVSDAQSKNGVFVNGVRLFQGMVELTCGSLLSLGSALLLARGARGADERPIVSGRTLHEICEQALTILGSQSKAARALHVKRTTLRDWLASHKFEPTGD